MKFFCHKFSFVAALAALYLPLVTGSLIWKKEQYRTFGSQNLELETFQPFEGLKDKKRVNIVISGQCFTLVMFKPESLIY